MLGGCKSADDKTKGWSPQKLYADAKSSLNESNYADAIKKYEVLEGRYPYGRHAQQAQLDKAYAYFKSEEPDLAIVEAERFIKLHPNHPNVDYAYYLKGLVNFKEDMGLFGNLTGADRSQRDSKAASNAFDTFRELVEKYPDSRYAEDSRQRMQFLVNSLAAHEIHVARYYYNRGAYIAAINRAQSAITRFPNAPANEDALSIMVRSYHKLGLKDLRDDSNRVLRQNFPKSELFALEKKKGKPWWQIKK